jgi:hypothetical protein
MGFSKLTAAKASGLGQRHVPTLGALREVCNKPLSRNHCLALNAASDRLCPAPGLPPAPQVSPSGRGTTWAGGRGAVLEDVWSAPSEDALQAIPRPSRKVPDIAND